MRPVRDCFRVAPHAVRDPAHPLTEGLADLLRTAGGRAGLTVRVRDSRPVKKWWSIAESNR
jgi:hypothetical protein